MTGNSVEKWNKCFYVLGIIVFCIGLVNLFLLREYPAQLNLEIKEQGEWLNPDKARIKQEDLTKDEEP